MIWKEKMFSDSHCHITSEALYEDVEALLSRAQEAGVKRLVNICTDELSLERGLRLQEKHPWVALTAATTPHDVEKEGESFFGTVARCAADGSLCGIGETGLDYYYEHSPKELQQDFLRRYLRLALEHKLPVVIHCRDAFADFFRILDEEYKQGDIWAPGILHCFTGTVAEAEEVIRRGWYLSLSGIVTFKKSEELREVARMTPLDQLLIETDSPYLAPQKRRGKRNEPAFLPEVAEKIADIHQVDVQKVASVTTENVSKIFAIS